MFERYRNYFTSEEVSVRTEEDFFEDIPFDMTDKQEISMVIPVESPEYKALEGIIALVHNLEEQIADLKQYVRELEDEKTDLEIELSAITARLV